MRNPLAIKDLFKLMEVSKIKKIKEAKERNISLNPSFIQPASQWIHEFRAV